MINFSESVNIIYAKNIKFGIFLRVLVEMASIYEVLLMIQ